MGKYEENMWMIWKKKNWMSHKWECYDKLVFIYTWQNYIYIRIQLLIQNWDSLNYREDNRISLNENVGRSCVSIDTKNNHEVGHKWLIYFI